ncbi:MarR family winged helix-turn-helix transcriptional regulator [Phycicoccus sp. Root563]|uniref:MarR family winged helix-turn-helix transcriptional regulator n=1 Tax=Phycicoccus sp. Root563 TaxID=1736562 RepID=UPI00070357AE|nr:MarR family transcriptional regulator [Phycicoccus sp. Root563]KQZ89928.1 transcriptional regulator [Phycicoccus sp. Root563]
MARRRQQVVDDLGRAMQHYQRSVAAFDDAVGRQLGLGPADLRCLDVLVEGPRTAGELSVATGLKPAATTALLDRLAAKGYVQREPSPTDRRKILVAMTEEGMRRTWAAYGPMVEEGQQGLASFTVAELERLRALLDGFTEVTDRHRERVAATAPPAGATARTPSASASGPRSGA